MLSKYNLKITYQNFTSCQKYLLAFPLSNHCGLRNGLNICLKNTSKDIYKNNTYKINCAHDLLMSHKLGLKSVKFKTS